MKICSPCDDGFLPFLVAGASRSVHFLDAGVSAVYAETVGFTIS